MEEKIMSDICSSFKCHEKGGVCITLDDPTFVRAETVLVDMASGEVQALLQQKLHSLGEAPEHVLNQLRTERDVTLRAVRIDGSSLELRSHVVVWH